MVTHQLEGKNAQDIRLTQDIEVDHNKVIKKTHRDKVTHLNWFEIQILRECMQLPHYSCHVTTLDRWYRWV